MTEKENIYRRCCISLQIRCAIMRKVNTKLLPIVVAALVAGILLTLGYQKLINKPQTSPSPASTQTQTQDETTSWKTYTDSTLGFSVKYPPDVTVKTDEEGFAWFSKSGPTQTSNTEFFDALNLKIKTGSLSGQSLETFANSQFTLSSQPPGEAVSNVTKTTLNGKNAYTFTVKGLGVFKHTLVDYKDQYLWVIDSTNDPTNQGFAKTVNQILSTFRFE